jgi:hypothetical protein
MAWTRGLVGLGLVWMTLACGPKAGGSCSQEDAATCADKDTMYACEDGKYREIPCRGPTGCASNGSTVVCDYSAAQAGDACPHSSEGTGTCTTVDSHVRLKCTNGRFVSETCVSPCSTVNGTTICI